MRTDVQELQAQVVALLQRIAELEAWKAAVEAQWPQITQGVQQ